MILEQNARLDRIGIVWQGQWEKIKETEKIWLVWLWKPREEIGRTI